MKVCILLIVLIFVIAVSADIGATSMKSPTVAARGLKRSSKALGQKVESVQIVGAASKAATAGFDSKAALQLVATFSVWYGFNAACKWKSLLIF